MADALRRKAVATLIAGRGFKDSEKTEPDWSKRSLDIYKKIYKIEADIKDESVDVRYQRRQVDSVPLLDALFDLCRECKADVTVLPKSPLGQACTYALKNETALRWYCTDGRLSIDNNISERTLREFVIGRKNWLFFGSPEAAKNSANIMSVTVGLDDDDMTPPRKYAFVILENYKTHIGRNNSHIYTPLMELLRSGRHFPCWQLSEEQFKA